MTRADMDELQSAEVWPCCWQAVDVFYAMRTQWRVGFNGATGLDYSSLQFVLELKEIPRAEWPPLYRDLVVLEQAALECMADEASSNEELHG